MKNTYLMVALATLSLPAAAGAADAMIACDPPNYEYYWDFGVGTQDFTTDRCDERGAQTWRIGVDPLFEGLYLWATTPGGFYPNDAGDRLLSPEFAVTPSSSTVEIFHWYQIAAGDGANVSVGGVVLTPIEGYPAADLAVGCLAGQPGFRGNADWHFSCFDLSPFLGETVRLSFNFAADGSDNARGWYIAQARVGGTSSVATTPAPWSPVKALYD